MSQDLGRMSVRQQHVILLVCHAIVIALLAMNMYGLGNMQGFRAGMSERADIYRETHSMRRDLIEEKEGIRQSGAEADDSHR